MRIYIVTAKEIEWDIPFDHKLITVGSYKKQGAMYAADYIGSQMNSQRTFAFYRGVAAALEDIKEADENDHILVAPHRVYLGKNLSTDLYTVFNDQLGRRKIITPDTLNQSWKSEILTEFPDGYDMVIARPFSVGSAIVRQHAAAHHLDDLLFGMACAVRAELISSDLAAYTLANPYLIDPLFATKISIYREIFQKILWIGKEFFNKYSLPRSGYQERAINFVLERILSAYLFEKVYVQKVPTLCSHLVHIDKDMEYTRTE